MRRRCRRPPPWLRSACGPLRSTTNDPRSTGTTPALATLLPDHLARRDQATVLRRDDGRLIVGMVDPADLVAVDDLRAVLREPFTRVAITAEHLAELLDERNKLDDEVLSVAQIVVEDSSRRSAGSRQPPRCRRGSADRQVREPRDPPGGAGAGVGHPRRAGRARPAHPVPHRRRAPRAHAPAPLDHPGRHLPAQGDGRHRHRRAPHPEGRSHQPQCRGKGDRPAGVDTADGLRREDRDANPRPRQRRAAARGSRIHARAARAVPQRVRAALRRDPRHRPDRLRQVDDALRHAQPAQRRRRGTS